MGVTGAGKTTVGRLLSQELGWDFADADDFHPPENIEKMRRGVPLTDEDRGPWLDRLRDQITHWRLAKTNAVLACSALKGSYRERLTVGPEVRFVYLKGNPDLITHRLHLRHGHFADEHILAAQFADIEEPKSAIVVNITHTPPQIVEEIREKLSLA